MPQTEQMKTGSPILTLVCGSEWAITREMLETIHQILISNMDGQKIDIEAIEAKLGKKLENTYVTDLKDGVAIIPVTGVLAKRMNLFMQISGGTSTEILMRDFKIAMDSEKVKSILLDVDSPGGTVDGTKALADVIFQSRGKKPVVAYANGLMASAAYWIGSSADVVVAEHTAMLGSIGVLSVHSDYSRQDEKLGIKRTMITSGKYKAIGNNAEPLSTEGREYIQEKLDYIYSLFVDEVSRNRGSEKEKTLEMADGRIFIGQQAVDIGLADRTGNFEDAFLIARDMPKKKILAVQKIQKQEANMDPITLAVLEKNAPELLAQLRKEAKTEGLEAGKKEGLESGRNEGMEAERSRVVGILDADADFEATKKAIKDGLSVEASFKVFYQAEKDKKVLALETLEKEAPKSQGTTVPENEGGDKDPEADLTAKAKALAKEKKITVAAAMKEIQAGDEKLVTDSLPKLHVIR